MAIQWVFRSLVMAVLLAPTTALAQAQPDPEDPATQVPKQTVSTGEEGHKETRGFVSALGHNLVDDLKHMPRWNSVYWLGAGGAAALAVHPIDDDLNSHLAGGDTTHNLWQAGHIIGSTYTVLGAAVTSYVVGRTTNSPRLQHLGMDEIEAVILSEGISQGLKVAVRRDRPPSLDPADQSNTYSFPSGHATLTFAAATVLQQHLGYKAGIPTYVVASYVAMSRLHDNRHYASDVIFGAATGIVIGRSVTWHGRNFYAMPMAVPGGAGIQIVRLGE